MKILPVEPSCSMRTGRHDEANSLFGNFAIAPKKQYQLVQLSMSINHQFSNELIAVSRNSHSDREKTSPRKTI